MTEKPGWIVHAVSVLETPFFDYSSYASQGFGIICRLDWAWAPNGTIPVPEKYGEFAARCGEYVAKSPGCSTWVIGNEFNLADNRPNGREIKPWEAASCHGLCYDVIKKIHPGDRVLVGALAPWNNQSGDWLWYLKMLVSSVGKKCDGYALHAYTHGPDPNLIYDDTITNGWYWNFHTYMQQIDEILEEDPSAVHLDFHITEADQNDPWADVNSGWIRNALGDVDYYNHNNLPQIRSCSFYRLRNYDKWVMETKPGVMRDFMSAANMGLMSGKDTVASDDQHEIRFPSVSTGGQGSQVPPAPDREWDPRLTDRGVSIITPSLKDGEQYWFINKAYWLDESQAGGRHHIYVTTRDEKGNIVPDINFRTVWPRIQNPEGFTDYKTKAQDGINGGNFPMNGSLNDYHTWIADGKPSEILSGVGMGADGNKNIHTSTVSEWTLKTYHATSNTEGNEPSDQTVPPRSTSTNPTVTSPVPSGSPISQRFGERPEVYSKYKIDGVPLKGHEGLDFAVPVGTDIYAIDDGVVVEAADQGNVGYGKYIKLRHTWGESVYAHLSSILVAVGVAVTQGQHIAESGNTGNSTGPHLHLGIRVNPYNRQDGWGGYIDPEGFLKASQDSPQVPSVDMGGKRDPVAMQDLIRLIKKAADEFNIDWRLLYSLIHGESSMNPLAENKNTGAMGLGQITPLTWGDVEKALGDLDPWDPEDNIRATAWYLAKCLQWREGNIRKAIWSYNWGPEAVRTNPNGVPQETIDFASKVIHAVEILDMLGVK